MKNFDDIFREKFPDLVEAISCGDLIAKNYKVAIKEGFETGHQSRQDEVDTLKEKIDIYENSISLLRKFHSGFNESSDSAYIVGVMDGFFKCLDEELLK